MEKALIKEDEAYISLAPKPRVAWVLASCLKDQREASETKRSKAETQSLSMTRCSIKTHIA